MAQIYVGWSLDPQRLTIMAADLQAARKEKRTIFRRPIISTLTEGPRETPAWGRGQTTRPTALMPDWKCIRPAFFALSPHPRNVNGQSGGGTVWADQVYASTCSTSIRYLELSLLKIPVNRIKVNSPPAALEVGKARRHPWRSSRPASSFYC